MKKENFVIGLIAVGAVAFFLGRLSVSPGSKTTGESTPAATTDASAKEVAKPAAGEDSAKGEKVAAAGTKDQGASAAVKGKLPRAIPRARGQISVVEAPYKGPEHAKVTIMEVSDYQ